MRILLTNDDGIDAPGLSALEAALAPDHEVWVCAPDGERSGTSHSIALTGPLRVRPAGPRRFACSGSPADCVFLARRATFIPGFDAVVAGINRGPNLGTDTLYSGTCAAARQAALFGLPALALSLATLQGPWNYEPGARAVAARWSDLLALCPPDSFLNVNFPARFSGPEGFEEARPAVRTYRDRVTEFEGPDGCRWCWVEGFLPDDQTAAGTDLDTVRQGRASYTVMPCQPGYVSGQGGAA